MKIARTLPPAANPLRLKDFKRAVSGMFFPKGELRRLEDGLKRHFGVSYAFPVSSGKAALTIILRALKSISKEGKKEVVIPAYTCFSVPSAIVKAGLDIAPCDIDPGTFDFDYGELEKTVNEGTLCIVPNHLFGIPSDMDAVKRVCGNKGVYIVEDAAQAMGGRFKGRRLGTIGDVGFFSFGRGKNITCGSGGVIITDSRAIGAAIEREFSRLGYPGAFETAMGLVKTALMAALIHPLLYWIPSGMPFLRLGATVFYRDFPIKRLSGMQAALLHDWEERLEAQNLVRLNNSEFYKNRLRAHEANGGIPYLRFPVIAASRELRDRIYGASRQAGLGLSLMYPSPVNRIEEIEERFRGMDFPEAERVAQRLLALPTHQLITEKDRADVCGLLEGMSPPARPAPGRLTTHRA